MSRAPGVAWIIGGGSGLGAELARQLAASGWTVAISGRRRDRLDEVASASSRIHVHPLDVTDPVAIQRVVRQLQLDFGRIDLAIFGAAAWQPLPMGDYDGAKFSKVIDTNLLGFVRILNPLVQQMEGQGGGEIVGIASMAGYVGLPRAGAYNASKAALISLLQTLRTELAPRNISVRAVSPGFFKSELTAKNDFPMPFLLETSDAARRTLNGLFGSRRFEIVYPKRLAFVMKLIRLLPYPLFFAIAARMMPKGSEASLALTHRHR